ncbi:MAG: hypothetical protein PVH41_12545 [Anaerolineae bacterium]|jgi:hypothetical protein
MNPGTQAIVALSALLVAWYVAGHLYNRRLGLRMRRWLAAGLDDLGGETEQGWIGSPAGGARVNVTRAEAPFRRLEVTLLLANRESPLLWLLDEVRKRRDRMIVRATLRSPRRGEVCIRPGGQPRHQDESWTSKEGPHGLSIAYRGHKASELVRSLSAWVEAYGAQLRRFNWGKQDPHIDLELWTKGLLGGSSGAVLADLRMALLADQQG